MRVLRAWLRALADGARDENARPLYLAAGGLLATGTVFYSLVERWTILDALYFCVTTLTTVGLGALHAADRDRQGLHDRLRPGRDRGHCRIRECRAPTGRHDAHG